MMMKPDTYFFSAEEALRVATQENRSDDQLQYKLQVCYYNGDKIDSDLVNLVHLSIDSLVDTLVQGYYRIPTHFDFTGLDISPEVAKEIEQNLHASLKNAKALRQEISKVYLTKIKNAKLDFSEPLRVYIMANSRTRVMQYISKDIADFFEQKGFDVFYDLLYGVEEIGCYKNLFVFNPHIIINLNHLGNANISDDVFNIAWYQDTMPIFKNNQKLYVRDRDFIFTYVSFMNDILIAKGVNSSKIFDQQIIPVNTDVFFLDKSIKKEKKIVFVGTKYHKPFKDKNYQVPIGDDVEELLENGEALSEKNLINILDKYNISEIVNANAFDILRQVYVRNKCVEWMCSNSNIDIEVYGYDWDKSSDENIINKFKGKAEKEELNILYNSAKYVLSASGQVINTQRLGEIIHAGAIPVIYDSRDITDEKETWEDECLYFKTKEELEYILDNEIEPKKYRTKKMLEYFTYDNFFDSIVENINKTLKEG